eukprot:TRINITY_DN224_c0_g1_i2.p1 TRINITY_DN224_c0_g1~~TRINITY_DN224_c0_g1_i2.p1  ORF type:complete len:972 (-),score=235.77 TRINITY_DN224_c0_g1_i2:60-2975(-)
MFSGKVYILVFVLFFCLSVQGVRRSGFSSVITSLHEHQTETGGFRLLKEDSPSLEATSYALFLASLFGQREKIDRNAVTQYLQTLQRKDGGFSSSSDQSYSDLASIRYALLSHKHLDGSVPESSKDALIALIRTLYSDDKKLFSSKAGGEPDIKSTAFALQAYELLPYKLSSDLAKNIKDVLSSHVTDENHFSFTGVPQLSGNYYGILVASKVNFDFKNPDLWGKWIASKQVTSGPNKGGFSDEHNSVTLESTAHAVAALASLPGNQLKNIDSDALLEFASHTSSDLKSAALILSAVARTDAFHKLFKIDFSYETLENRVGVVGDRIISGAQIKPVLTVKSIFNTYHSGFDISLTIRHADGNTDLHLNWSPETLQYVATEFYSTEGKLGPVHFEYDLNFFVTDLQKSISVQITDSKNIGYSIKVQSEAVLAGKAVDVGQVVGDGAEFAFKVTISNYDNSKLNNYPIRFLVLDSSDVVVHSDEELVTDRKDPVFNYVLSTAKIPSGNLNFKFEVKNEAGVHTTAVVTYQLDIKMISTDIKFIDASGSKPVYQIGKTVRVSMKPASFPDLSTIQPYAVETAAKRHFEMIVSSPVKTLHTIKGKAEGNSYLFELPIAATFDSIGNNAVSFRYVPTHGSPITLTPISETEEDLEDLSFKVEADLNIVQEKGKPPKDGDLHYGNEVSFSFQVKDSISQKLIWNGESESVFLSLKHETNNKQITSSRYVVQQDSSANGPKEFKVFWEVNPNTEQGKGSLEIVAVGADGTEIPLKKGGKTWRVAVNIGGTISHKAHLHVSPIEGIDESVVVIPFNLSCNQKALTGAQLGASIFYQDESTLKEVAVNSLSVARSEGAEYQVSWKWGNKLAKGGNYVVKIYREVDRLRALEKKEILRKQLLKKQAEQKRKGEPVEEQQIEEEISPIFSVSFEFYPETSGSLPFRTEFFVIVLFLSAFVAVSMKKSEIEGVRKVTGKKKRS